MFRLNCIDCGYTWLSSSADICECPMCGSSDIVVLGKEDE